MAIDNEDRIYESWKDYRRRVSLRAETAAVDPQDAENHVNHILGDDDDEPAEKASPAPSSSWAAPAPAQAVADPSAPAQGGPAPVNA